jgi:hypothetical protein
MVTSWCRPGVAAFKITPVRGAGSSGNPTPRAAALDETPHNGRDGCSTRRGVRGAGLVSLQGSRRRALSGSPAIETHESPRKQEAGLAGDRHGQEASALDAVGPHFGAPGMLAFAILFWLLVEEHRHLRVHRRFGLAVWSLRCKMHSVARRRTSERTNASAMSQSC